MSYIAYKDDDGNILTEDFIEQRYEEMLAECYEPVTLMGSEWDAATALKRIDPVMYRMGLLDYLSDYEEVSYDDFDSYWEAIT